eukprot:COSAG05_NODE_628_length_8241_cov_5.614468_4_plen_76_part_00
MSASAHKGAALSSLVKASREYLCSNTHTHTEAQPIRYAHHAYPVSECVVGRMIVQLMAVQLSAACVCVCVFRCVV